MKASRKNDLDFLHVYLISDFHSLGEEHIDEALEQALQGGVRALQLREKDFGNHITIWEFEIDKDEKLDLTHDRSLMKFSNLKPEIITREDKGPYCNRQYEVLFKQVTKLKSDGMMIMILRVKIL